MHSAKDSSLPTQTPQHGWSLRVVEGALAWSSWPLTAEPLRVGRGIGCRLRIDDTRVSRLQCEIWTVGGSPHVRNHSQANPTRVNGQPITEASLRLGDFVEFAGYRFIADHAGTEESAQSLPRPVTTRAFEDTPFQSDAMERLESHTGGVASDLMSLFHFSRRLACAMTLDALADTIRGHLAARLRPKQLWLSWPCRPGEPLVLYPAAEQDPFPDATRDLLLQALAEARGALQPLGDTCLIAAPLAHMGRTVGVIGVHLPLAQDMAHPALDYLMAVAECVAPHLLAVEHLEQLERDVQKSDIGLSVEARLVGESEVMMTLRQQIRTAAATGAHVMLLGETGTGKELAARLIHDLSERAEGPYVAVNCASIAPELFDSEMFGHERGAFTGAAQRRRGLFEEAHGGTLFLDELGELSTVSQARLLRAADLGLVRRVGSNKEVQINARIVSATNRMLPEHAGNDFRMDLYHRLAQFQIHLPPLRERKEDIPALARHFLKRFAPKTVAKPVEFAADALEILTAYDWPGNVRELRNVVERACFLARGPSIARIEFLTTPERTEEERMPEEILTLGEVERRHIHRVLEICDGDVAAAATALRMPKSTLYYKLARHGLSGKRRPRPVE